MKGDMSYKEYDEDGNLSELKADIVPGIYYAKAGMYYAGELLNFPK